MKKTFFLLFALFIFGFLSWRLHPTRFVNQTVEFALDDQSWQRIKDSEYEKLSRGAFALEMQRWGIHSRVLSSEIRSEEPILPVRFEIILSSYSSPRPSVWPILEKSKLFFLSMEEDAIKDYSPNNIPFGADGTLLVFERQLPHYQAQQWRFGGQNVVRAHTVSALEIEKITPQRLKSRVLRAVQERSVRFILWRWNPAWDIATNRSILSQVQAELKKKKFNLAVLRGSDAIPLRAFPFLSFRLLLACVWAGVLPALILFFTKRSLIFEVSKVKIYFDAFLMAMVGGMVIPIILPDAVFSSGIEVFRGVKVAFLLGIILSAAVLFRWEEWRKILTAPLLTWQLFLAGSIGLVVVLVFARSGNAVLPVSGWEVQMREILEAIFIARPRFKEFLWGYPLFVVGIFLFRDTPPQQNNFLARFFLLLSSLGWVSVVNSFCHLHTPLFLTFLRSINGCVLGGMIGLFAVFILHRWRCLK